jgi:CubicO group peptidase (beta-lactamase class C family)
MRGALATALAACSLAVPAARAAGQQTVGDSLSPRVDRYIQPYLDLAAFSGAVLVARHGNIMAQRAYGMANYELAVPNRIDTRFHIASLSKTFTAAAILELVEGGKLSLSDLVAKFVPDYPRGGEITIHQLLAHSSGIPDVNGLPGYDTIARVPHTTASLVALFRDQPLDFAPGSRYSYSNSNYNLLAYILERVSGLSYGAFLEQRLLRPAALTRTAHDSSAAALVPDRASGYVPVGASGLANAPYIDWTTKTGNGSLYSTVEDLFRWDRALHNGQVLSPQSVALMFTPQLGGVGYGWMVGRRLNRRVYRMSGRSPGFSSEIQHYPDQDLAVVVLSNNYAATATTIATDLAAMALGEPVVPLAVRSPAPITSATLDRYAGRYVGGEDFLIPRATLTLDNRHGTLVMSWSSGAAEELIPQSDSTFLDRNFWSLVRFVRSGGITGQLIYRSGGKDYIARRAP